jgi:RND superfamily putative drug exporter
MRSIARWCAVHRLAVLAAWIVIVIVMVFAQSSTGSNYAAGTQLTGTPSAQAAALLQSAAPSVSGDSERIVFEAKSGTVTDPQVRASIQSMLGKVAGLRSVGSISSPYTPAGSNQISANHKVAFATVDFTKDTNGIPSAEATTFVNLARAPNSRQLQVDVLGNLAASTNPSSSTGTLVGVVAALIVLLIVFGTLLAALVPLLTAGLALIAGLSLVGILSNSLSMASFTSQLCILIGLGVGIDYSLFVMTRARSCLRRGLSPQDAVATAAATAGRAVIFAGITVCIALLGMLTVGVSVLSGAAIAASVMVLFPMIAAQTLLPAFIGLLGPRILTRRQRAALARGETDVPEAYRRWFAWAARVERRRIGLGIAAAGVLVLLAVPFSAMRQGTADYSTDPTTTSTTTYRAFTMLDAGFGPGFTGPLEVVAPIHTPADRTTFDRVVQATTHATGVAAVAGPVYLPAGPHHPGVAVAEVYSTASPQDAATSTLITHLRTTVIPHSLGSSHLEVLVGGQTALADDFANQLSAKLPLFVGMVVVLAFVVLMVLFRSLAIPATAAIMNLLSAAAAFGVIVAIFQWGWLDGLVGVSHTGPITPLVPILMFAVLFGLSMDYEVFLVSRMHEEWLRRRNNSEAVNFGQAVTGRTITAAAAIMIVVFASFVATTDRTIKMIGLGMAIAILLDALLIRTILVPAVMHTIGNANWHLPSILDRFLPKLALEAEPVEEGEGVEELPEPPPSITRAEERQLQ